MQKLEKRGTCCSNRTVEREREEREEAAYEKSPYAYKNDYAQESAAFGPRACGTCTDPNTVETIRQD